MDVFKRVSLAEQAAADFGFMWSYASQLFDQIQSECDEIKANLAEGGGREHLQEEIGDLIHAAFSLCLYVGLDVEETSVKSITKFERRFEILKQLVCEAGLSSLQGQPRERLIDFWNQAKQKDLSE